ncbi:trichohyalin-like [Pectinophora gossypiella]|uniref:trichohyalin-like n=1 Tax=Pectinophora gossypiella TaxID=13191 RepID=UPI00214F3BE3|nr:trichohyalin-like [Pectinophora gossypiella]
MAQPATSQVPIVVTKDEWGRILKWTDTNREDPEVIRRREYLKYLNDTSAKMTKNWPNSLENVNKRNEEVRRARIEAAENANSKFYKRYVKRKREEQQRLMYSARDTVFKNKDAPKLLLSAVVESCVLKEREEQIKFDKEFIHKYNAEQKRLNDEDITRRAKEWNDMMDERKKKRFQVNKQHQKELLEQAAEVAERERKQHEEELSMQRQDIINSNKEMKAIKKFETEFKEAEKARIWADNKRSMDELQALRNEMAARDKMDDKLIDVLLRSRCRIEAKRKATEKEIRDEKLRVLDAISKKLESGDAARDAREQASLEKAKKERDAAVDARHKAQEDKEAKHNKEKRDIHEQFLRDQAQKLHDEHNMMHWELMNRFKNQEIYEDYKEQLRLEKERKIKEYRENILAQWKERDERDAREKAETRYFYGALAMQKLRDADNKLLTHAAALLKEARDHGRPTLPIQKAIQRYCSMYRLYPMPDLPASLQEHFQSYAPWDGSKPDRDYREPAPPPPDRGPDAPDDGDDARCGLQDLVKVPQKGGKQEKPAATAVKKAEAPAEDYKRQGPANGLQRRPDQENVVLPPIEAQKIPCRNDDCLCNIKYG